MIGMTSFAQTQRRIDIRGIEASVAVGEMYTLDSENVGHETVIEMIAIANVILSEYGVDPMDPFTDDGTIPFEVTNIVDIMNNIDSGGDLDRSWILHNNGDYYIGLMIHADEKYASLDVWVSKGN